MKPEPFVLFPPFRLDPINACLWYETRRIPLRPKTFSVLCYLLEHVGRLVTTAELLHAVWPGICVGKVAPMICIRELRKALADDPKAPRFIETVHRRGYRFIGTLSDPLSALRCSLSSSIPKTQHPTPPCVGRETELAHLHRSLEKALRGERQVVFVTGEAGIGKTTLVETFVEQVRGRDGILVGWGQGIEQHGEREAYLPVLEVLGRLCREITAGPLIELLRRSAPTWLVQMPWLMDRAEREALQWELRGATRERMLREMGEWVDALTVKRPLVLILEDLHAADYSTLDLISFLAQQREPAQFLLIGTYRALDAYIREHPLSTVKHELYMHRLCEEMVLGFLDEVAVAAYLALRFPGRTVANELAEVLYRRTEGNPLFLVNMVEYLVGRGVVRMVGDRWELKASVGQAETGLPESLRQMLVKQIERLSREHQQVLEAASVVGVEFAAAAVAAGLGRMVEDVEERCEELARRWQLLRPQGTEEWPDGTLGARYSFVHSLYHHVLYERIPPGKRVRLHQKISDRLEQGDRFPDSSALSADR